MKKNNLYKFFFALMMLIGIVSCEDRENLVIEPSSAAILMDLSADNLVLDENFPSNAALTITWQPSTYSIPTEIKYSLEISATEDFANSYVLTTTQGSVTTVAFTNKEMNDAAKNINLTPYVAQKMYLRVSSFIGTMNSLLQKSAVTNITVTPYVSSPPYAYSDLFLVGNATPGGWDNSATNNNLIPLMKTASPTKYTYTGFFLAKVGTEAAGFKMIRIKGLWDPQLGMGSGPGLLSTDGGSGNLTVPADGYYKLTVDTAALTYTLEPYTPPATTYAGMSIIGTVNGDDFVTDKPMVKSSFDPHLWSLVDVSLKAGEFKFRADNSWDNNWGTNSEYFGTATKGGANIPLTSEWRYTIYFNDATGDYTILPLE